MFLMQWFPLTGCGSTTTVTAQVALEKTVSSWVSGFSFLLHHLPDWPNTPVILTST